MADSEALKGKAKELLEKAKAADGYIRVRRSTAWEGSPVRIIVGNEKLRGNEWNDARRYLERRGRIKEIDSPSEGTQLYEVV